ncbi:MAG: ATPase, T2SS/T4P/T4SS family [bacterium]|nr:ATPase, T2SS/T4P/T4SS family [bacterium]
MPARQDPKVINIVADTIIREDKAESKIFGDRGSLGVQLAPAPTVNIKAAPIITAKESNVLPQDNPVLSKILTSEVKQKNGSNGSSLGKTMGDGLDQETILDILLERKLINKSLAEEIKLEYINTGQPMDQLIARKNIVTEKDLTIAKGIFYNVPFVALDETPSSPDAVSLLSRSVAQANNLLPFNYEKTNNILSVAMANPLDLETIDFLEKKTNCQIKPFIAVPSEIKRVLAERYGSGLTTEVTAALKDAVPEVSAQSIDIKRLGEVIHEAPIAKIVSTILEFAVKSRASDIHLEPQGDRTRVRYRIDGILHEKLILPKSVHEALISRIKILSGMKIDEKRVPQDGRFNFHADEEEVDLRVSCLPTSHGEKIVMRLLRKATNVPSMQELGLRGRALKNLDDAILRPHGIIIICGPTGSGKTTSLYAILSKINSTRVNISTLEDPVEYQIAGVNQVQINPAVKLNFATGLRAFLRQDPNIIMVGEIRDSETADLAIQAALTGHLVFSTLHTNTAAGALPRLLDMKAEPFLLASSMTALVAQRICRRTCDSCKKELTPSPEVVEDIRKILGKLLDLSKLTGMKLYHGTGCTECNNTGYLGRIGIFEVLPVTEKISRLILERSAASSIEEQAVEEGMITIMQDGYLKVVEGITTIEEVLRVAQA